MKIVGKLKAFSKLGADFILKCIVFDALLLLNRLVVQPVFS